jgi:predicted SAM-dependent methyltransferase
MPIFESLATVCHAGMHGARRAGRRFLIHVRAWLTTSPRIVVGAGGIAMRGWILTDREQLDVLLERDWMRYFVEGSIDAILAEHVWEHLTAEQAIDAAQRCFRYLRPGGRLRIAVPDGLHPDPQYIEAVRPGGSGPGANDHKVLYTLRTLCAVFEEAGFETRALEHFDAGGNFHAAGWNATDGTVRRSSRFDQRNEEGRLRYTSIIIDAIKPPVTSLPQRRRP